MIFITFSLKTITKNKKKHRKTQKKHKNTKIEALRGTEWTQRREAFRIAQNGRRISLSTKSRRTISENGRRIFLSTKSSRSISGNGERIFLSTKSSRGNLGSLSGYVKIRNLHAWGLFGSKSTNNANVERLTSSSKQYLRSLDWCYCEHANK